MRDTTVTVRIDTGVTAVITNIITGDVDHGIEYRFSWSTPLEPQSVAM
jgi:hypothetical protein